MTKFYLQAHAGRLEGEDVDEAIFELIARKIGREELFEFALLTLEIEF